MALGKRMKIKQQRLWISYTDLAPRNGHPFYSKLNRLLDEDGFDTWLEGKCGAYFAECGRPSIPPGVYFRMLFLGYLEGFASERSIAWNCQDRLSLRDFLGYELHERTPDHSSFTIWRQRLPLELFGTVFQRIVGIVHRYGLIDAYAAGIDSTTIEANASLRRLSRKDTGALYNEYVKDLMREAGEDPQDPSEIVRFDKKRKGKSLSNQQWQSDTDPDSRIARMKDGTTHLAYKSEHAVDLATGAMLGVNIYLADQGDTATVCETLQSVKENLDSLGEGGPGLQCVVTDKGYHKAELIKSINIDQGITTYIPERQYQHRRCWQGDNQACREFHANRRRTRSKKGKRFAKLRAELAERSFALFKCSGNLARMALRGINNVTKRYTIQAAAYNLALIMRTLFGHGTPKGMADAIKVLFFWICNRISIIHVCVIPDNNVTTENDSGSRLFRLPLNSIDQC